MEGHCHLHSGQIEQNFLIGSHWNLNNLKNYTCVQSSWDISQQTQHFHPLVAWLTYRSFAMMWPNLQVCFLSSALEAGHLISMGDREEKHFFSTQILCDFAMKQLSMYSFPRSRARNAK